MEHLSLKLKVKYNITFTLVKCDAKVNIPFRFTKLINISWKLQRISLSCILVHFYNISNYIIY